MAGIIGSNIGEYSHVTSAFPARCDAGMWENAGNVARLGLVEFQFWIGSSPGTGSSSAMMLVNSCPKSVYKY